MPGFASCAACHGFVADLSIACVHCAAPPPRRRSLARYLLTRLVGVASAVTLMACYGDTSHYDCYDSGDCYEACTTDADCLEGDYCDEATWTCEPSSTCYADADCPVGMECDEPRNTCLPVEPCTTSADCDLDERCEPATGTCVPATPCWYGTACEEGTECDYAEQVCVPCVGSECGACTGEVTCEYSPPDCPEGTQPAIEDGCYTAACIADAVCAAEACAALDETACIASEECGPSYVGINCTNPDGSPCTGGGGCTCESYEYDACLPVIPPPDA